MLSRLTNSIYVRLRVGALLTLTAVSCSGANDSSDDYEVGRQPELYSAAYLWGAGDSNAIAAVDRTGMTLQRFTLEPFAHVSSLPLPLPYRQQGVVSSHDGAYFVTLGESEYSILKADGTHIDNPLPLLGKIESVAFEPTRHFLVISDEFQTMVLLVLDESGTPTASWKGGARISEDLVVRSGTMMSDGRLVLALGATTIGIVDVAATVQAQAWQYTTFEVADATDMKWITPVPDQSDTVMVIDGTRVLSLNVATGAILGQEDLAAATTLGYYRDYVPHVIVRDSSSLDSKIHNVIYVAADGTLAKSEIIGTDRQISETMLAADGTLTVVYNPKTSWSNSYEKDEDGAYFGPREVYRFRLSDNAGLDKSSISDSVNLAITPNYLFMLYPSRLGKAVRRGYGPEAADQVVSGYNFEMFRNNH